MCIGTYFFGKKLLKKFQKSRQNREAPLATYLLQNQLDDKDFFIEKKNDGKHQATIGYL